jgi:hypothetical protein
MGGRSFHRIHGASFTAILEGTILSLQYFFMLEMEQTMRTDTIAANSSTTLTKPIDAFISYKNDDSGLFNVYLEFIIYRIRMDAESYRKTLPMVTGNEEKMILLSMAAKKEEMCDTLILFRTRGHESRSASTFDTAARSLTVDYVLDTGFKPFQSPIDAFHFAYRKEYESLTVFEKIGRLNLKAAIRILLEGAMERQRQHILHLDAMLWHINNSATPIVDTSNIENTGTKWALTLR